MIRVGVIGAGAAALTAHLPALAASDRFTLAALLDLSRARLDAVLERFPVEHALVDRDAFFGLPDLDAVVVATPPGSHAELAAEALRAGRHVLVEKPLARSLDECRLLVGLAAERGLTLAVGHEKRFHPTLERVCALLEAGACGEPFYVGVHWASNAKLDPARLVPEGFRHGYEWRWRDLSVGGGLLQDHLPHYVDLVRRWTGGEPTSVYADCLNAARDVLGWKPEASAWEDLGLAIVRFSSGLVLRFETSVVGRSLSPLWSLGSGTGEWTEYAYVLGSAGQLVVDLLPWDSSEHGRIALWQLDGAADSGRGWTWIEQPEPRRRLGGAAAAMFAAQADAWADLIEGRASRIAVGADGAACVAAVEAAYRSAAARAEVPVETMLEVAA